MLLAKQYSLITTLVIVQALPLTFLNAQHCELTQNDLQSSNQVFFVDDKLMRETTVPIGSSLKLACKDSFTVHKCSQDTKHNPSIYFDPPLPNGNNICGQKRHKPEIPIITSVDCPETLYAVGFKSNSKFTELYRACFNQTNMRSIYVQHTVYRKPFTTNRQDVTFTMDRIISGADARTCGANSIHKCFIELLGSNQKYIKDDRTYAINRGHLAPSADFLFIENKRATFKYINVMPQFATINNGNWKTIEEWVQRLSRNTVNVKTGTIGVLMLPHSDNPSNMVPMYLGAGTKNPIPQWTYKIVDNDVFLTYNNPFAKALPRTLPCSKVNCPNIGLKNDFKLGYTICCNLNSLLQVISG